MYFRILGSSPSHYSVHGTAGSWVHTCMITVPSYGYQCSEWCRYILSKNVVSKSGFLAMCKENTAVVAFNMVIKVVCLPQLVRFLATIRHAACVSNQLQYNSTTAQSFFMLQFGAYVVTAGSILLPCSQPFYRCVQFSSHFIWTSKHAN